MKTTVEIADALLREAERIAAKEPITVRALLEEGLRRTLEDYGSKPRFRLRDASLWARWVTGGLEGKLLEASPRAQLEGRWSSIQSYGARGGARLFWIT